MSARAATLSENVSAFMASLRAEHGFKLGLGEVRDALRVLEAIGVTEGNRLRAALRMVCCASPEEIDVFERAFDSFFLRPERSNLPRASSVHRIQAEAAAKPRGATREEEKPGSPVPEDEAPLVADARAAERREADAEPSAAATWRTLLARYSPNAAQGGAPEISPHEAAGMMHAAGRLIAMTRAGRARKWRPLPSGARLDLRRTLRASLRTAGDPVALRRLGHPLRNPRFVVLLDGSRSMKEQSSASIHFAYALAQRSRRARVFIFSTELREITRSLHDAHRLGKRELTELGEAWGGGTRIGGNLLAFVREFGERLLDEDTTVLVASDGLDGGDIGDLRRALRAMRTRGAAIVWLNPHAGLRGFRPSSRAMQAALPLITALVPSRTPADFHDLPERIALARRSKWSAA